MPGRSRYALIFLLLSFARSSAEPCIQSALLTSSTVSITRYFDEAERATGADFVGIQGTGWFMSPTTLVTVEHVATAMRLSTQNSKPLNIQGAAESQAVVARIQRLAGDGGEKFAVLELQTAVSTARAVSAHTALQEEDTDAGLRIEQVPGSPHPRIAASDDDHVGALVPVERRPRSGATGLLEPPSGRSVGADMRTLIPDGEDPSSR